MSSDKRKRDTASVKDEPESKVAAILEPEKTEAFMPVRLNLNLGAIQRPYSFSYNVNVDDDGYETDETIPTEEYDKNVKNHVGDSNKENYLRYLKSIYNSENVDSGYETSDTEPDEDNYRPHTAPLSALVRRGGKETRKNRRKRTQRKTRNNKRKLRNKSQRKRNTKSRKGKSKTRS